VNEEKIWFDKYALNSKDGVWGSLFTNVFAQNFPVIIVKHKKKIELTKIEDKMFSSFLICFFFFFFVIF
jgi:hypothetical protein